MSVSTPIDASVSAPRPDDLGGLLQAVARGDVDAFNQLHEACRGLTYGVIRKVLRAPDHSEEVVQEVLTEVWRTAARFDPLKGSGQTWILTIAHRRAIDRVRSVQASRNRTMRCGLQDQTPPFDEVAEDVETRFEHEQVRAAMAELTDLEREAVELAYHSGYSYREVAELLGKPLGTVKTRIRKGLMRLRTVLDAPPV